VLLFPMIAVLIIDWLLVDLSGRFSFDKKGTIELMF